MIRIQLTTLTYPQKVALNLCFDELIEQNFGGPRSDNVFIKIKSQLFEPHIILKREDIEFIFLCFDIQLEQHKVFKPSNFDAEAISLLNSELKKALKEPA